MRFTLGAECGGVWLRKGQSLRLVNYRHYSPTGNGVTGSANQDCNLCNSVTGVPLSHPLWTFNFLILTSSLLLVVLPFGYWWFSILLLGARLCILCS